MFSKALSHIVLVTKLFNFLSLHCTTPIQNINMPANNGAVIVIMGVSGAGKTTIGRRLEKEMNYKYLDADDFHPESNKEKMRMGIPLTDEDRMPWLESLRDTIKEYLNNKKGMILGCSALKKQYREMLRSGDRGYKWGTYASVVNFILLDAPADVLSDRVNKRAAEGKHYMPASLLQSQLDLLQIDESEGVLRVDATLRPQAIVNNILNMHKFQVVVNHDFVEPHW